MASPVQAVSILDQIYYSTQTPQVSSPGNSGPWRPTQWANPTATPPALTLTVTLSAQSSTTGQSASQSSNFSALNSQTIAYVFDTVTRLEHNQQGVVTLNPVQTGAAVTDHFYVLPARVTIEILMSDAMQSFTVGQFSQGPARSVNAYQTLVAIQASGNPVALATRLNSYNQMIITDIHAVDDKDTRYGLRVLVTFTQIIIATATQTGSTSTTATSQDPQSTGQTQVGPTQTQIVPNTVYQNNNIANSPVNLSSEPQVSNSGNWTSYNVNQLSTLYPNAPSN